RLARADGDHSDFESERLLRLGQQVLEEARLLGGRGRGDRDEVLGLRAGRSKERGRDERGGEPGDAHAREEACEMPFHGSSPLRKFSPSGVSGWVKNRAAAVRSATSPSLRSTTSSAMRRAKPSACVARTMAVPDAWISPITRSTS